MDIALLVAGTAFGMALCEALGFGEAGEEVLIYETDGLGTVFWGEFL